MNLNQYDFELPKGLIAQRPVRPRSRARLLVYNRKNKTIADDYFYNLDAYLPDRATLVLNNSKVEKCRLLFGKTEIFVLDAVNQTVVKALVKPGKRFQPGSLFEFDGLKFKTLSIEDGGERIIELSQPLGSKIFDKFRKTPLPPYIEQNEELSDEYQTVYARPLGSKASPTAGLHFTKAQLKELEVHHDIVQLTLHVGLGTFGKLSDEQIKSGRLHPEKITLNAQSAKKLNKAGHITAVGTTSARVLESVGRPFKRVDGSTDIFIKPGYKFKAVDSLITNFHLPKTSLLMLVSAFIGSVDEMQAVYAHAIKNNYRFYSFGDAMLII